MHMKSRSAPDVWNPQEMKTSTSQTPQKNKKGKKKKQEQTVLAKLTINGHFIGDTLEVKKAGKRKQEER